MDYDMLSSNDEIGHVVLGERITVVLGYGRRISSGIVEALLKRATVDGLH